MYIKNIYDSFTWKQKLSLWDGTTTLIGSPFVKLLASASSQKSMNRLIWEFVDVSKSSFNASQI